MPADNNILEAKYMILHCVLCAEVESRLSTVVGLQENESETDLTLSVKIDGETENIVLT